MKTYPNLNFYLLSAMFVLVLGSCTKDPETLIETVLVTETVTVTTTIPTATPTSEKVGSGGISFIDDSQTWTNDRIWLMDGKIVVRSGGTLNIESGTIIKSHNGQGVDATALVIAPGGTINAAGTSDAPVIFADIDDNIDYGDGIVSPNRVPTDTGLTYEIVNKNTEMGLFYNVQGKTLEVVGVGNIPDVYTDPFNNLNFTFNKKIGAKENQTITFGVRNILNDTKQSYYDYYGEEQQKFSFFKVGRTFSLGYSIKFLKF